MTQRADTARAHALQNLGSFDVQSLPRALLTDHALKSGTWVWSASKRARSTTSSPVFPSRILEPGIPGVIPPNTSHSWSSWER